ncbi:hypothetical protein D9615_008214 [Tricholomella constricta]|uniref:Uncharacterized protein n=1 Tax=Tricholomella constricta TaxID=117010 RepID=A0A8H5H2U5_9AGAR|nr:hypothetical protein D9615_008214 [Tricholomella constricta]
MSRVAVMGVFGFRLYLSLDLACCFPYLTASNFDEPPQIPNMVEFPWDSLKAGTLRTLCRDLGFPKIMATKDVMIRFLTKVEQQGPEKALSELAQILPKNADKSAPASPAVSPSKRKLGTVVSDYDTRHKRTRRSDPGPGLSRRTARGVTSIAAASPNTKVEHKRRGRPPKSTTKRGPKKKAAAAPPSPPADARREIFDGVVLPTRQVRESKGKEKAQNEDLGEEDAEGDVEMELEEEVEEDGGISRVESSLASSNKENESIPGDIEANDQHPEVPEEDNAGDDPSTRVLESTVQMAVQLAIEDMDAEGEDVAELDEEGPDQTGFLKLQETHFTPEDINQIEQALMAAATNALSAEQPGIV